MSIASKKKKLKNSKGFSLVELIIVIAIMVALIAVMGPQYVRYIQKSRDTTMRTAANDCLEFAKTEYANGDLTGEGMIYIDTDDEGHVCLNLKSGLSYKGVAATDSDKDAADIDFESEAGLAESKKVITDIIYAVVVKSNGDATTIEGQENPDFAVTQVQS